MGSKQTRKQSSASARVAVLQPQEELGPRGAGLAKRVKDPTHGDAVLVTLDAASVANAKARRYFKRHVEALKGLAHPNLVKVFDGGTDDGEGRAYLIEADCPGKTLRQVLAEGPLAPEQALRLALDLLNGLSHAHHHGLVHGGLTPDGVLVEATPSGPRARIVDLGVARVAAPEQETPVGPVRVDTDYAAPEMIKGEATDARADVYSVGLILHEMLVGKHPIPAPPKNRVLARLNDTAPDLPAGTFRDAALDDAVRAALRAATQKNPARRFASARAFALALRPGAQAGATGAAPTVAPSGGSCVACQAAIKPAAERTWSRHESDQPFECPTCRGLHCGKTHWDPRSLTCKKCHEKPVVPHEGAAPADVDLAVAAPTPAPTAAASAAPPASAPKDTPTRSLVEARREALRGLLERDSADDWRALKTPDDGASKPAEPAPAPAAPAAAPRPAEPAPVADAAAAPAPAKHDTRSVPRAETVDDALAKLWADEKARHKQAVEKVTERFAPAPAPDVVPVAARPTTAAPGAPADDSGRKLIVVGLAILLPFVAFGWYHDRVALRAEAQRRVEAERKRTSEQATLAEERGQTAVELRRELDQAGRDKAALEERLATTAAERAALLEEKGALEARLAEAAAARDALAAEKAALDARLAETAATLAALEGLRAELERTLAATTADREALEARLGEVTAAHAALDAERAQLLGRLDQASRALDESRAQRDDLQRRLRRALVRLEDQALELDDLQLQMMAASRIQDALADEKEALEARLAEAQELLRAQQDLLSVLSAAGPEAHALAAHTLASDGRIEATDAPTLADGRPLVLTAPLEALTSTLDAAAEERGLVTVRLQLDAAPGADVRASVVTLGEGGAPGEDPRELVVSVDPAAQVVRAWLTPADAAHVLGRAGTLAVLVEAPGGAACRVTGASLVLTPLDDEVAARLRAARR